MSRPLYKSSQFSSQQLQQKQETLDKYMVKSYIRSSHLNNHQSASTDYGIFNQYKLDDLIDIQSDGFNEHKAIRLAFVDNNSIHLQEEAVELFQKYGKNQLAFVGLYGHSEAGKSLILDKLINLCEFPGSYMANRENKNQGIYLWSVPFSKGNTKFFLLDMDGYSSSQHQSYFMLLDLLLLLCSSMVFVAQPDDYSFDELSTIYKHIKKSRSRFRNSQVKQDTFWPNSMYCLFRRPITITKGLQSIIKMFNNFNFTIIDDAMDQRYMRDYARQQLLSVELKKYGNNKKILSTQYIKRTTGVIRDIIVKIESKIYLNLRYTGANLIKLSVNAVQYLNLKNYMNIDKLFRKSMKELYYDAYHYHTQLYNETLIGYLSEQQPMQVDYLLKAFQICSQESLKSFNSLKVDQELKEQYSQKLEKYIEEKEKMVLEINKKKSKNKAKISVPDLPSQPEIQQLQEFIRIAKKAPKNYQQVYSEELKPQISTGLKVIEKKYKNQDTERQIRQKSKEYQRKIEAKSKQLEEIRRNKSKKEVERSKAITLKTTFQNKEKIINQTLKTLKSQCMQSKVYNLKEEEKVVKSSKSAQMLKAEEQALRRQRQKREKMISELRTQSPVKNIQLISKLQSKISEKISQQKQLENVLNSNMKVPTIHVLKSMTSINSPRKVQTRAFNGAKSNMRIIPSPKA